MTDQAKIPSESPLEPRGGWAWLFLALVVGMGAWLRFYNAASYGMCCDDQFDYWFIAQQWTQGNFTLADPLGLAFPRPVAYLFFSLALKLLGSNDHAIKLLNAFLDSVNILLVLAITYRLTRQRLVALAAALLYACTPILVYLCHEELVHIISAHLLLWSSLVSLLSLQALGNNLRRSLITATVGGLLLALAGNTHQDLAFLGPGFVALYLIQSAGLPASQPRARLFLLHAALFTLGFFAVYSLVVAIFGLGTYFNQITFLATYSQARPNPLLLVLNHLTQFMGRLTSELTRDAFWLAALALLWAHARRPRILPAAYYAPLVLWLSYSILFAVFTGRVSPLGTTRLLSPLVFLVCLAVTAWPWLWLREAKHPALRQSAGVGVLLVSLVLAGANLAQTQVPRSGQYGLWPQVLTEQTFYRAAYDVLRDRVTPDQRVLVTPYLAVIKRRGLALPMYLGPDKVRYIIDCQDPELDLARYVRQEKIKYILVAKGDAICRTVADVREDHNWPPVPEHMGACYGWTDREYSLEKEYQALERFVETMKARKLFAGTYFDIYQLPDREG